MRSVLFLAVSAIASLAAARENPFNIPSDGYSFTAGEPTKLSWQPTTQGTVSLKLQSGTDFTLSSGTAIASGIANSGSYTWNVPSDVADQSDYTVQIVNDSDADDTNYLPRFSIQGAEPVSPTSSSMTTTHTNMSTSETTSSSPTTTTTTDTTMTTSTSSSTITTSTTTDSSSSPTPTSTSASSETSASTTSESMTSTDSSASPSDSATSVPSVSAQDGDNAGMANRVSGGLLALALGVFVFV